MVNRRGFLRMAAGVLGLAKVIGVPAVLTKPIESYTTKWKTIAAVWAPPGTIPPDFAALLQGFQMAKDTYVEIAEVTIEASVEKGA